MNKKLRSKAKNDFKDEFWQLMNTVAFGRTMENVKNTEASTL